MFSRGVLLHELGRAEEAEAWYRKAADAGHTNVTHPANPLGSQLDRSRPAAGCRPA